MTVETGEIIKAICNFGATIGVWWLIIFALGRLERLVVAVEAIRDLWSGPPDDDEGDGGDEIDDDIARPLASSKSDTRAS